MFSHHKKKILFPFFFFVPYKLTNSFFQVGEDNPLKSSLLGLFLLSQSTSLFECKENKITTVNKNANISQYFCCYFSSLRHRNKSKEIQL